MSINVIYLDSYFLSGPIKIYLTVVIMQVPALNEENILKKQNSSLINILDIIVPIINNASIKFTYYWQLINPKIN